MKMHLHGNILQVVTCAAFLFAGLLLQMSLVHSCLFNETHCWCSTLEKPGKCLRHSGDKLCTVMECRKTGYRCDCTGTELCYKKAACTEWRTVSGRVPNSFTRGIRVECEGIKSNRCVHRIGEVDVPDPEPQEPELRMVQFGIASDATMFNLTTFNDLKMRSLISKSTNMHGKWRNAQRLLQRYITMRIYRLGELDDKILCAIYNSYALSPDGLGEMQVGVTVKGTAGQELHWVACDDIGECKGRKGSILSGIHYLPDNLSDGWCVSPLSDNGEGISVKFENVNGMRGISFQSADGLGQVYKFGEGHGMEGSVDKNGIVKNGRSPDIVFNVRGIIRPP